jgi:large subunit ribosomal protein L19
MLEYQLTIDTTNARFILYMFELIQKVEQRYRKPAVVDVRTGDTVRVHQKVKEGSKERVQIFEGVVIRTDRKASLTSSITVRRIASGVGVEKTYLLHSPLVLKVEVVKRSKVRRKYLSYLRERSGKSARLSAIVFDKDKVNTIVDKKAEEEEAKLHEQTAKAAEAEAAKKEAAEAELEAKAQATIAAHEAAKQPKKADTKTKK